MQTHGVGCYTSQAAMKMFNRQNELLADSAERAGVTAQLLTALPLPDRTAAQRLDPRLVAPVPRRPHGHVHPTAYQFSWNDELSAANQFAGVLTSSTAAVANALDTRGEGVPLVVYNPLSEARHDVVEATVDFPGPAPQEIAVTDLATGRKINAQTLTRSGQQARVLLPIEIPAVGYKMLSLA